MERNSTGRRIVGATVVVAALVGAFLLGRATAPDVSVAAGPDCSQSGRSGIDVPAQFLSAQGTAFFSECEHRAALGTSFGQPASRVNIYASETGSKVVAWWYPDCGLPEGVFPVGTPHPAKCSEVGTTAAAPKP